MWTFIPRGWLCSPDLPTCSTRTGGRTQLSWRCFWAIESGIAIHFIGTGCISRACLVLHLLRKKLRRAKSRGRELCVNTYLMWDSTAIAFIQEVSCVREMEYFPRVFPGPPHCWCTSFWARERSWSFLVESMCLHSATLSYRGTQASSNWGGICRAQCRERRDTGVGLTLLFRRPHSLATVLRKWGLYCSQT